MRELTEVNSPTNENWLTRAPSIYLWYASAPRRSGTMRRICIVSGEVVHGVEEKPSQDTGDHVRGRTRREHEG